MIRTGAYVPVPLWAAAKVGGYDTFKSDAWAFCVHRHEEVTLGMVDCLFFEDHVPSSRTKALGVRAMHAVQYGTDANRRISVLWQKHTAC